MNNNRIFTIQYWLMCSTIFVALHIAMPCVAAGNEIDDEIKNRVENLSSIVDARYTKLVEKHIKGYTKYNKSGTERLLGKISIYFPMFERVLIEKGLPEELKYLSIIESGLNPRATSKVGATGLWQFMKSTGQMMGLEINYSLDERRDPLKSTKAAAEYLKYLYNQFDDWTLALAAYNCGPGNVRKAIKRSGGKKTFWEIHKFLPRETRDYIPKYIAICYTMNYYYIHGLTPELPEDHYVNTASAMVFEKVMLKTVSARYNIRLEIINKLNPAYIRGYIPANNEGDHILTLPIDYMIRYINDNNNATLLSQFILSSSTEISSHKAKISERELLKIDRIENIQYDKIPFKKEIIDIGSIMFVSLQERKKRKSTKLRRRESLKQLSIRVGTPLEEIIHINNISKDTLPNIGSTIYYEK